MHQDTSTRRYRRAVAKSVHLDTRPALRVAVSISMLLALLLAIRIFI